jgi:hypothetical protein
MPGQGEALPMVPWLADVARGGRPEKQGEESGREGPQAMARRAAAQWGFGELRE